MWVLRPDQLRTTTYIYRSVMLSCGKLYNLEALSFAQADTGDLPGKGLVGVWATRQWGSEARSGAVVVGGTAQTTLDGDSTVTGPVASLRTENDAM